MFAWINFQCKDDEIPGGYVADYGEWYGDRGNGMIYGWDCDLSEDGMWNVGCRNRGLSNNLIADSPFLPDRNQRSSPFRTHQAPALS